MRTCVILNPAAGGIDDPDACRDQIDRIPDVVVRTTEGPGEARRLAARATREDFGRIVAAGGDGTLNEVLNGVGEELEDRVLGLLPLGTANDFARSLGLPLDPGEAVDALVDGSERRIDAARLSGRESRLFLNVVVGGFGGRIREHVDEERKRAWGPLAYMRSAIEELERVDAYGLRMEDGEEEMEEEVYHLVVANGSRAGGNIPVAPEARPDDGLLDVVLIRRIAVPQLVTLVPRILAGRHLEADPVRHWRTGRLRLRSDPPMRFTADGEDVGEGPLEVEVLPGAVRLAVPSGAAPDRDRGPAGGGR